LAWDRDAAADISKQFETAWKRHKVVCIWAQYFHNVANEFRLALGQTRNVCPKIMLKLKRWDHDPIQSTRIMI
jgi:hypothetical protein